MVQFSFVFFRQRHHLPCAAGLPFTFLVLQASLDLYVNTVTHIFSLHK